MPVVGRITPTPARAQVTESNSLYLTAEEGVPVGNLSATTFSKKDHLVGDLSVQAANESNDTSPAWSDDGDAITPEQLQFTTAISRAMSKDLVPLLAGLIHHMPGPVSIVGLKKALSTAGYWSCVNIYRAPMPKQLCMTKPRVFLKSGRCSTTLSIRLKPNRTRLKKYSSCWRDGFSLEKTACKFGKPSCLATSWRRKTGCSTWMLWKGYEGKGIPRSPSGLNVIKSCSALLKAFEIPPWDVSYPLSKRLKLL